MIRPGLAILVAAGCLSATRAGEEATISTASLLTEMIDYTAVARRPEPAYVSKQDGSWDRRTKTREDVNGWFANGDNMEMMGAPAKWVQIQGRHECVMLDVDGPGAIVRFWSGGARPKGKVRFYLDGAEAPVIEAPLYDLLGGTSFVPKPLAITNSGEGINLYLPIPYAKHCKITYDEGQPPAPPPGRWYNIEYRAYPAGTKVQTFAMDDLKTSAELVGKVKDMLAQPDAHVKLFTKGNPFALDADKTMSVDLSEGPSAVGYLGLEVTAESPDQLPQALRSTVLRMSFDGTETVWCPVGEFFGCGPGLHPLNSWYRTVKADGTMSCRWVMPYQKSARVTLVNLGTSKVTGNLTIVTNKWRWDERSMYFHANWRKQDQIQTKKANGTMDWNYINITGKGMYLGDTLTLYNPTRGWWGEGDEKIIVDGEAFPSHIGTGTEDYYGYAWGNPALFQGPFCNQPCAHPGNFGRTVNTRTRSLDAVPFTKSLQFDMEIWHWEACKMDYAVATYWYALPGATSNREGAPQDAAAPLREPPTASIKGAIEFETMKVLSTSEKLAHSTQTGYAFAEGQWNGDSQLFVQATKPGGFIELQAGEKVDGPRKLILYATKSYDYGILRFTVNGKVAEKEYDGYAPQPVLSGPFELGVFEPKDGKFVIQVEVTGANPAAKDPKYYFGLDAIVLSAP
jgi:hypothetical protein